MRTAKAPPSCLSARRALCGPRSEAVKEDHARRPATARSLPAGPSLLRARKVPKRWCSARLPVRARRAALVCNTHEHLGVALVVQHRRA